MSSHHFVKDKQEPALIIANGESCSEDLLGQLLEWNPYVVVLDDAMDRVLELGIKPDVWLGDFDRRNDFEQMQTHFYPLEIVHRPDTDHTDLEKALDFLIEKGYPAANIVWATGRRADHAFWNISLLVRYQSQIKTVMFDDHSKIFPIHGTFEKWYAAGTILSLVPIGEVKHITTQGLKYNLTDEALVLGYRNGQGNETLEDGFIRIIAPEGNLLIMECKD